MLDLSAYLARIRLPARPTLDAAGLRALHRAHRLAIPFENLDVALGRPIAIDSAAVFAKLVGRGRGGLSAEQHRLFADALAALGFAERPLLAQGGKSEAAHVLSLVTVDGEDWVADPGAGGGYWPPLPLVDGAEAAAGDARLRLTNDGDGWTLARADGNARQPLYRFTTAETGAAALAASLAAATDPAAPRLASIVLPNGVAALTDRDYCRQVGDAVSEGAIADPRVYRMRLSLMFGIDLTRDEVDLLF